MECRKEIVFFLCVGLFHQLKNHIVFIYENETWNLIRKDPETSYYKEFFCHLLSLWSLPLDEVQSAHTVHVCKWIFIMFAKWCFAIKFECSWSTLQYVRPQNDGDGGTIKWRNFICHCYQSSVKSTVT